MKDASGILLHHPYLEDYRVELLVGGVAFVEDTFKVHIVCQEEDLSPIQLAFGPLPFALGG